MSDPALLLQRTLSGDPGAAKELLPLVYDELRRIAVHRLSMEAPGQTLQPTALVHDAWLRLGADPDRHYNDRRHFLAVAAEAMRHILIDRARRRRAIRHGGELQRADIDDFDRIAAAQDDEQLLAVHESLDRLAAEHPRQAELVKLRYFVGLTLEEAAGELRISAATAKRDWAFARAWLYREIAM